MLDIVSQCKTAKTWLSLAVMMTLWHLHVQRQYISKYRTIANYARTFTHIGQDARGRLKLYQATAGLFIVSRAEFFNLLHLRAH